MSIVVKSKDEIVIMREAGRITARVLNILEGYVKPGIRTEELDPIAAREAVKFGAKSSFLGQYGYPYNLCISVNDEIVHGMPGKRVLKEGDIVSLDYGVIYKGFQGDMARTVPCGTISAEAAKLIDTTREALKVGIAAALPGNRVGDIAVAVESYAESLGYSVVREYTGHGIGRLMHEEPQIPNSTRSSLGYRKGTGPKLVRGMTFALEPMVNIGGWETKVDDNKWTVRTVDGSLSAHFEDTIAVTDGEPEVLTALK